MEQNRSCIDCAVSACDGKKDGHPDFCLSKKMPDGAVEEAVETYLKDPQTQRVAQASAEIENDYYGKAPRVEETILFAKKLGVTKIGIATCVGLLKESRALAQLLRFHGFEVYGIGCKAGEVPKTEIGIPARCEEVGVHMCNPVLQAKTLNREGTELNIVMGLCVGHDSLFYKYADALTTTLVTKDRVTGHNPVAVLNCLGSYYRKLMGDESLTSEDR